MHTAVHIKSFSHRYSTDTRLTANDFRPRRSRPASAGVPICAGKPTIIVRCVLTDFSLSFGQDSSRRGNRLKSASNNQLERELHRARGKLIGDSYKRLPKTVTRSCAI